MTIPSLSEIDLTDTSLYTNGVPQAAFKELRDEGPIHRHKPVVATHGEDEVEFLSIVRHAEIQQINRDWENFTSNDGTELRKQPGFQETMMTSMDPPVHARLRRLISSGFTPRMVARLDDLMVERTDAILEAAATKDSCDFVRDIAYQLPLHIIADIVGIPESERQWIFDTIDRLLKALDPTSDVPVEFVVEGSEKVYEFATALTAEKREHPTEDVWSKLTHAEVLNDEGEMEMLGATELDFFFITLAIAGSETTRNAISQGMIALDAHPDQLEMMRNQPDVMGSATEEILRWSSPVLFFGRSATKDTVVSGYEIAQGERVVLWYPSGNRDERAFDEPFRFDIQRANNHHVSFGGGGPHFCMGANLAKRELNTMMTALVRDYDVELLGPPVWTGGGPVNNVGVALDQLPAKLTHR